MHTCWRHWLSSALPSRSLGVVKVDQNVLIFSQSYPSISHNIYKMIVCVCVYKFCKVQEVWEVGKQNYTGIFTVGLLKAFNKLPGMVEPQEPTIICGHPQSHYNSPQILLSKSTYHDECSGGSVLAMSWSVGLPHSMSESPCKLALPAISWRFSYWQSGIELENLLVCCCFLKPSWWFWWSIALGFLCSRLLLF